MEMFSLVGILATAMGLICILHLIYDFAKEHIEDKKYEHKYKHRFDKPPTANCYCVDCKNFNAESHRCYGFHEDSNRLVADNYFCYRSEPRKREGRI